MTDSSDTNKDDNIKIDITDFSDTDKDDDDNTDVDIKRWIDRNTFIELVHNNPHIDYCSYSPPRGYNRYLFCAAIAESINRYTTNDSSVFVYRCSECMIIQDNILKPKIGRGELILKASSLQAYKQLIALTYPPNTAHKRYIPHLVIM